MFVVILRYTLCKGAIQRGNISAGNADIIVLALVQRVAVLERVAADDGRYKLIAEFSASDGFSNNSASFTSLLMAVDSIRLFLTVIFWPSPHLLSVVLWMCSDALKA